MASTHRVVLSDDTAVKTYRSWSRGEPSREWAALRLLDQHVGGLAARPLELNVESTPPFIVMSRLPGKPLGGVTLTTTQIDALAVAIYDLHHRVPESALSALPRRLFHAADALTYLAEFEAGADGVSRRVDDALRAATAWLNSADADPLRNEALPAVLGQADGNLANMLWDGRDIRLVDFEDSGRSDRAWEIADLLEHPSSWLEGILDAASFLSASDVSEPLRDRIASSRRAIALHWLTMLLPGGSARARNPPGTVDRQADRLLALL